MDVMDFYRPLGNVLSSDEIITEIRIPRPAAENRQVFIKHRVRDAIDFAIVSVGLVMVRQAGSCSSVRIVLGAVAPGPHRASKAEAYLEAKALNPETIEAAAELAVAGALPLSRNAYKIDLAKTLVKRALSACTK
ncbi:CO dehydrogenase flavoprotein C-terminal domain protein [delta proteobacterium NaphS2]|nr:CO dehydrogenase flavoprotein C-terminal domain protein [delta proteobacterium NaphS2]